jgi:glycosyltransferase involved in cell wall biosynthesis
MRICVDGFPLRVRGTGIGTYTREMVRHLLRLGAGHRFYLADMRAPLQPLPSPLAVDGDFDEEVARRARAVPRLWGKAPYFLRRPVIRAEARSLGADLFFATNFLGVFDDSFKTVLTIHDLAYLRFPEAADPSMRRLLSRNLRRDAHRAHAILADSDATRAEVLDLLGVPAEKVHTVHCGVDPAFRPVDDPASLEAARRRHDLPEKFLLFVGTLEPRKNLPALLAAFAELTADPDFRHDLVLVGGKGWKDDAIRAALAGAPPGRVRTTGYVPAADLPLVYGLADALVMPSQYEGFGLPVLEAMACGTPVVTSNVSSLPEVAGGAAVLVDPRRPSDIAAGIRRVVGEPGLREQLRRKGLDRAREFTWEKAARLALEVFEQVAAGPGGRSP